MILLWESIFFFVVFILWRLFFVRNLFKYLSNYEFMITEVMFEGLPEELRNNTLFNFASLER